ncbi:MAG: hypothetical protein JWN13_157 [Betaproteobacteria bacterium]|jgi:hypothetical protein|nr:hypothetical protein [Betaproteobacteria bacterium]MEA3156202.1 hypothetical protein [Betaproteobacteria bacterium]
MQAGATGALGSLESLPLAVAMRHDLWLYPVIEVAHIAGFVVLVGSIVVLDLRLLGLSRGLPVSALTRHVLPWSFAALLMIVPTGLLMFIAHASDFIGNRAFQLKLLLILFAAVNAGVFHTNVYRSVKQWDKDSSVPAAVRVHAAASLMLWFSVLACGRLIAYL